jgi:hypothetical protein
MNVSTLYDESSKSSSVRPLKKEIKSNTILSITVIGSAPGKYQQLCRLEYKK